MTQTETKQAAAVMIAWAEEKKIQSLNDDTGEYRDVDFPIWDWCDNPKGYRIAPELLDVEVWYRPEVGCVSRSHQMRDDSEMIAQGWTLRRATIHPETK